MNLAPTSTLSICRECSDSHNIHYEYGCDVDQCDCRGCVCPACVPEEDVL